MQDYSRYSTSSSQRRDQTSFQVLPHRRTCVRFLFMELAAAKLNSAASSVVLLLPYAQFLLN